MKVFIYNKRKSQKIALFLSSFIILFFTIINLYYLCQSVEKVIDQNFNKEQKIPEISDIENVDNIHLGFYFFK